MTSPPTNGVPGNAASVPRTTEAAGPAPAQIMHRSRKKEVGVAVLVIAIGVSWLLNVLNVMPGVNWVWTLGLGVIGVLSLALGGLNQLTVIIGPFLIAASILSVLRQTGQLTLEIEAPVLMIVFGALLLCSYLLRLPLPKALQTVDDTPAEQSSATPHLRADEGRTQRDVSRLP